MNMWKKSKKKIDALRADGFDKVSESEKTDRDRKRKQELIRNNREDKIIENSKKSWKMQKK